MEESEFLASIFEKKERLLTTLLDLSPNRKLSIAFSGGVDSRFLAFFAKLNNFTVELLHVAGPHIGMDETKYAESWAKSQKLTFRVFNLNPLQIPEVSTNSRKRCYYCKHELFSHLLKKASYPLCDGTNHSDLGNYRPGLQALAELKIHSPLAESGLSKRDIREIGAVLGLDNPQQPSKPCVLTRFPYDSPLSIEELSLILKSEAQIEKKLFDLSLGGVQFRLRKVNSQSFELHLQKDIFNQMEKSKRYALIEFLEKISPKFKGIQIRSLEQLSGFFDVK